MKTLGLGAVNRATLGSHLEIPIFTRATGTGAQAGLRLVYDSQFWLTAPPPSTDCSAVYGTGSVQIPDGKGFTIEVFNLDTASAYAEAFNSQGDEVDGLLKDPNGNEATTSTSSGTTSYYDPLSAANSGVAALTQTGAGTPTSPVYFAYTGSNGNPVQTEEQFESFSVTTAFGCGSHTEWSGTATVPSELDLPDGSKYTFGYDSRVGMPCHPDWSACGREPGGTRKSGSSRCCTT